MSVKRGLAALPIAFDLRAVSLLEGLRAGVAIAVTMAAASLLDVPALGLAALGALLACLADTGGPITLRLPILASFGVAGAVLYAGFGLLNNLSLAVTVPAATAAIFCLGFLRIYGQALQQLGNMLSVVVILALDRPLPSFHEAVVLGAELLCGVAWAMVLTLAVWRIRPFNPARTALGRLARRLAELAADLDRLAGAEDADFDAHARRRRQAVREAIEQARAVALNTVRQRGNASERARRLAVWLGGLQQLFNQLIAISDTLAADPATRAQARAPLRLLAHWLAEIVPDIEAGRSLDTPAHRAGLDALSARIATLGQDSLLRHLLDGAAERLTMLATASNPAGRQETPAHAPSFRQRLDQLWDPVRSNLSWASVPFRHTLRLTLVIGPAFAFTLGMASPFAHWLTITLIFTMQPYFSAAWVRALERIGGTVLGGLIAAVMSLALHSRPAIALTMMPLTVLAFSIRGVSFAGFIAVLTPVIVLLVEQFHPGSDQIEVAAARVGFTIAGGALAVLANLVLFPGFEANRLEPARLAAVTAHRAWLGLVFEELLGANPPTEAMDAARRQAGLSSNNLDASISRALLEPHRRADPALGSAIVTNAALRRMAGRLSVLALERPAVDDAARPLWTAWQGWLTTMLGGHAEAPRPALPPGEPGAAAALARLARQAELIAYGGTKGETKDEGGDRVDGTGTG